ncbi:MAG: glycosyl transferase [Pelagibacterium sp. SCN 63-23]|nr:MAG: glycosyl transferase [Pelagibacterium sp. SCN 63-23]
MIGRNEGARLIACLASIGDLRQRAIYVDSGSLDGSQARAMAAGVQVLELGPDVPFTAARARDMGFEALLRRWPELDYVQFVDGDCALDPNWVDAGGALLDARPKLALACGRRRERYPERSVYNAMCDREWDGPTGSILECGGDFLVRVEAFSEIGGFRSSLIAGEEPELCLRLRERGWDLWRMPREMTLHDANIIHFGQWWRRAVRAGHAFAEVSWLHRASPKRIWQRQVLRALLWAALLPITLIACLVTPWALLLLLAYPINVARQAFRGGPRSGEAWRDALFAVLGKLPEAQGILKYHWHRLVGARASLIEYKSP